MRIAWLLLLFASLAACNSTTADQQIDFLKKKADTLVKKVETSEAMDSIKSKGGKLWNSTKSKGGRLVNKGQKELNDLKKKF